MQIIYELNIYLYKTITIINVEIRMKIKIVFYAINKLLLSIRNSSVLLLVSVLQQKSQHGLGICFHIVSVIFYKY